MMQEALWMMRRWHHRYTPRKIVSSWYAAISGWLRFWRSYQSYKQIAGIKDHGLLSRLYPCIGEDTAETLIEPIYFYQDTWAFEKIVERKPKHHIDVGSHHKFVAFLSKVMPVTMIDIRPLSLAIDSIQFKEGSILNLPFSDNSIDSLSSLCVVEHIGLGRYGDPLDPSGSEKAIAELKRVICPNGHLYISMPIDVHNTTFFNAHRAFEESYIEDLLQPLKIVEKKYIVNRELVEEKPSCFCIALYQAIKPI